MMTNKINTINNNLSFKAKYLNNVNIEKLNPKNGNFEPEEVSLVEFDPQNVHDTMAICNTHRNWPREQFASAIAYQAMLMSETPFEDEPNSIYIMTQQKNNFDYLDDSKILGLAEIEKENKGVYRLNYIQTDPEKSSFMNSRSEYKNIGKKMLDFLKTKYTNSTIKLNAANNTVAKWYKKNGFKLRDSDTRLFEWRKTI